VREAAVIGIAHPRWSEALVAVVVVRASSTRDEAALISHCKAALAGYKVPIRIVIVDSLPKNSMDKVIKRELRETLAHLSTEKL